MERITFAYKGITECCGADLVGEHSKFGVTPVGYCATCGKEIMSNFQRGEERWSAPPIFKQWDDVEKISAVRTIRSYGMVKMYKRYRRKGEHDFKEAKVRAAVALGSIEKANRWVSYSFLNKSRLTFNAKTGRTFYLSITGTGKNKKKMLFDVTYNLGMADTMLNYMTKEQRASWLASCILRRIELNPHQTREIMMVAEQVNTTEQMAELAIALRWPYLINTGLPLTGKPIDYNRRVYRIMAAEKSGTKLVKAMFPKYTKPVINFIRATGGYSTVIRLSQTFNEGQLAFICNNEVVRASFPDSPCKEMFDVQVKSKREYYHAEMKVLGARRMLNQFLADFEGRPTTLGSANISRLMATLLSSHSLLMDTLSSLRQIRTTEGRSDYVPGRQPTLRKMHDLLASELNKCRTMNRVIPYEESDKRFEMEICGWTFSNAVDTHQLVDVGSYMHICVGGYGHGAVEKKYNIVVVTDDKGDYVMCLEHRSGKLVQAKGMYDQVLDEPEKAAVRYWAEKVGIDWKDCYDMRAPKDEYAWAIPQQAHAEVFNPPVEFLGNVHVQAIPADPIVEVMQDRIQPEPQFAPMPAPQLRWDDDDVPF